MLSNSLLNKTWLMLSVFLVGFVHNTAAAQAKDLSHSPKTIVFNGTPAPDYAIKLLENALSAAGNTYQLRPLGYFLPRGRAFESLANGKTIDVIWGNSTIERESRFLPIRIPIYKGLIGWRIPLVKIENKDQFAEIRYIEELRAFQPGQHHIWTDTKILRANDINVFGSHTRDALMDMLLSEKFDYFPRSAIEILGEYHQEKSRGIHIDQHILIKYPTAYYYYVHKNNKKLAQEIETGLSKLVTSGQFEKLFNEEFGDRLQQLNLGQRTVFELHNPFLSDQTPLKEKKYWLNPKQFAKSNLN